MVKREPHDSLCNSGLDDPISINVHVDKDMVKLQADVFVGRQIEMEIATTIVDVRPKGDESNGGRYDWKADSGR
jgi:hypothetical protein